MLLKEDSKCQIFSSMYSYIFVLLCNCNILKTTVAAHLGQDAYEKINKKINLRNCISWKIKDIFNLNV